MAPPGQTIETRFGPVQVWGDFSSFDSWRPLVFVVRGFLPLKTQYFDLATRLPDVDFAFADLPGMGGSPVPREPSVPLFAAILDEALSRVAGERRVTVLGSSFGGVAALAMHRPQALVLLDPPLSTIALWPLLTFARRPALIAQPAFVAWSWGVLGIGPDAHVNRDYRPLLAQCALPGVVLVPDPPLGRRLPVVGVPGLTTAADRVLLSAHPTLAVRYLPDCGHNIYAEDPAAVVEALTQAISSMTCSVTPAPFPP